MGDTDKPSIVPLPGADGHRQPPPDTPRPWENTDRAQAAREGATGPEPPAPPVCPDCGLTGDRRPTYYDAHVLLEPGLSAPAHMVPAWHRWYVDSHGVGWNSQEDEPAPGAVCRIPHHIACPGLKLEEIGLWRWLDTIRAENARRARRRADEEGLPNVLPDAG
ncbi:DUF6083 domain-containing protein [Streptomyces brasiliscabiei]|uniref:DUF6083 domain-containing protein n=1 Tax=Streptomyces brasiliscabiei TaxID=2736302 RepID=UPI001C10EBCF|nr:DUF6083 domain-containing protein [Streptomyces brasiliscabiei]